MRWASPVRGRWTGVSSKTLRFVIWRPASGVDNWALSAFRRRHGHALNDAVTQVLEWAQQQGMGRLGRVAIDSTRIAANACKDRVDSE